MRSITFDIDPVPASRPRVTRWGTYYPEKYTQFRKDMAKMLLKAQQKELYTGALKTDVVFYIPIPKSKSKKQRAEMNGAFCVSNMDLDNLEKALYDSMNGVIYEDDKQIVQHLTRKVWIDGRGKIEIKFEVV